MRILIVSFSDLAHDPRVSRQIDALREEHEIVTAGTHAPSTPLPFIAIPAPPRSRAVRIALMSLMRLGVHDAAYAADPSIARARASLAQVRFDCVIANDVYALPLCLELAAGRPVVLDAHEYSPLEGDELWWWRRTYGPFYTHLCKQHLPRVRGMMTVCDGIADAYARNFGIPRPAIVYNAPHFRDIAVRPSSRSTIRLVHHGGALPARGLGTMIDAMRHLDARFTLDFLLLPSHPGHVELLKKQARDLPSVTFRDPVPMEQLPEALAAYDVGVYVLRPGSFNHRLALPNKLFEFVQARLAIAIGPSPEMERVVRRHGLGIVSRDFSAKAFAESLATLTPELVHGFRTASDRAARTLSFESSAAVLRRVVAEATA